MRTLEVVLEQFGDGDDSTYKAWGYEYFDRPGGMLVISLKGYASKQGIIQALERHATRIGYKVKWILKVHKNAEVEL